MNFGQVLLQVQLRIVGKQARAVEYLALFFHIKIKKIPTLKRLGRLASLANYNNMNIPSSSMMIRTVDPLVPILAAFSLLRLFITIFET